MAPDAYSSVNNCVERQLNLLSRGVGDNLLQRVNGFAID